MEEKFSLEEEQKEEKNLPFLKKADLNNTPTTRSTFSKKEHIKSFSLIRSLFTSGNRVKNYPITLVWKKINDADADIPALVGFSVPKKFFKNAVERNKIKRKMREAYRLYKKDFFQDLGNNMIAMMFIYNASDEISYEKLDNKLISCCKRLVNQINETD